jgi:hypothetical protein
LATITHTSNFADLFSARRISIATNTTANPYLPPNHLPPKSPPPPPTNDRPGLAGTTTIAAECPHLLQVPPHAIAPILCVVAFPLHPRLAGRTSANINDVSSPHRQGVRRFAAIERNVEMMMVLLMKEEVDVNAN